MQRQVWETIRTISWLALWALLARFTIGAGMTPITLGFTRTCRPTQADQPYWS